MIVLDTCALYWWTNEPAALSTKAASACRKIASSGALVCAVSLWELGLKAKRGQIDLGCPVREYAERLQQVAGVEIVPADAGLWLDSLDLDWAHRDPADRLIAALARRRHLPIVTADTIIGEWYPRTIW
jgi:PIN domain nuclease of toxin-antitoxin system